MLRHLAEGFKIKPRFSLIELESLLPMPQSMVVYWRQDFDLKKMNRNLNPKSRWTDRAANPVEARQSPGVGRQAIEGNPLTGDELAMFEMFEREGWSPEQRRSHILSLIMAVPARLAS
ncbi:hypothetical protein [Novosphingobium sp.]|uniref:hypothetical protein n=1 Tax=Novosphingobium sp. TaxID=1874826 RepID=UPI002FE12779